MVIPPRDGVNETAGSAKSVGGWLLLLCLLLLVGQPINMAIRAGRALGSLPLRGLPLGLVLIGQLVVTGIGIGAGMALLGGRQGAPAFARAALILSAGMDVFIYSTPFMPNNRFPGTTPLVVGGSLLYHAIWIAYLSRSKRVRETFRTLDSGL